MASSSLLTNIPAEYSIRFLFVKFGAKSRHKSYTRPLYAITDPELSLLIEDCL